METRGPKTKLKWMVKNRLATLARKSRQRSAGANGACAAFALPMNTKKALVGRAFMLGRDASQLCRYAVNAQEARGWKDVPNAKLSPAQEKELARWLASGGDMLRGNIPVGLTRV